jgi:hypothetical protein
VKRLLFNKISFTFAVVAIFLVGMLRDPDLAIGDPLDATPVAHDRVPGYQFVPDGAKSHPLTQAEIAALNAPKDDAPTF